MKIRPKKKIYPPNEINRLRNLAIEKIKCKLLPDEKIIKICLIGSSIKNDFGQYEPPGFRGSLYSDFDFIIFIEDDYDIPIWLEKEPNGKPFSDDKINLAYRNRNFIDNKYDVEVFFIRKQSISDKNIQKEGELAGIPMTSKSTNNHLVIFYKNSTN
jgi:hypothetical protein